MTKHALQQAPRFGLSVLYVVPGQPEHDGPALEALALLPHDIHYCADDVRSLSAAPWSDVVVYDATARIARAAGAAARLGEAGVDAPLLIALTEGGLAAARPTWGASDLILAHAGPAEVDMRLRLAHGTALAALAEVPEPTVSGALSIDENSYTATLAGERLELTHREFELLAHLVRHPGRVFTRDQLVQDVWGYDYFGGTRTVDVHVRRLRSKLDGCRDATIETVRGVGYRFSAPLPLAAAA